MRLHLIHHRRDLDVAGQIYQMVGIEVAHTYGAELALLVGVLQRMVCTISVAEGLMQQHQVQVVGTELAQALVYRCLGLVVTIIRDPDLRHQEDILARYAAFGHGGAYAFLVMICLCGIYHAIARGKGIAHTTFALAGST